MEKQAKIRDLLATHKIEYTISTMGNFWQSNNRGIGTILPVSAQTEYKIYVRKADYEEALYLLDENQ